MSHLKIILVFVTQFVATEDRESVGG